MPGFIPVHGCAKSYPTKSDTKNARAGKLRAGAIHATEAVRLWPSTTGCAALVLPAGRLAPSSGMSPPETFHELIRFCREQVVQIRKAVEKHRGKREAVEGQLAKRSAATVRGG